MMEGEFRNSKNIEVEWIKRGKVDTDCLLEIVEKLVSKLLNECTYYNLTIDAIYMLEMVEDAKSVNYNISSWNESDEKEKANKLLNLNESANLFHYGYAAQELSFAQTAEAKKIFLYNEIKEKRETINRMTGDGFYLLYGTLNKIYRDYFQGYNYPFSQYKFEVVRSISKDVVNSFLLKYKNGKRYQNPNLKVEEMAIFFLRMMPHDIKVIISSHHLEKYYNEKLEELNLESLAIKGDPLTTESKKIKWKGSPAQFGFIIQQLIEKGFVEKPTSSYEKDASRYLQIFDIETTQGTLAKELSPASYNLTKENEKKFKIPRIDELK